MYIRIIVTAILVTGLGLFIYSHTLPTHTDTAELGKLLSDFYGESSPVDRRAYYEKEAELRTNKTRLMDLGAGLSISSGILLIVLLVFKIHQLNDFKKLRSFKPLQIFAFSNIAWLLLVPGTHWYYLFRGMRGDYPPFADSIGIPIYIGSAIILLMMIPINIIILVSIFKTRLPSNIVIRADNYTIKPLFIEIAFMFMVLINIILIVFFIVDGDHVSIPVFILLLYSLLSLRAGQMRKWSAQHSSDTLSQ